MEIPNTPKGISESEKKAPTTTQTNVLLTLSDDMKEFVEFLRSPSEEDPKGFVNKFIHRMKNSSEEERDPQSVIEKTLKSEVCWNKLKVEDKAKDARREGRSAYPVGEIFRKYPSTANSMLQLLDGGIVIGSSTTPSPDGPIHSESADLSVTLEFSYLLPYGKEEMKEKKEQKQEQVPIERKLEPEMALLREIVETPGLRPYRRAVLKHPLVQSFVELKWERFQRPFAIISLIFYLLLSVLMTVYVIHIQLTTCRVKLNLTGMEEDFNYTTRNTENNRTFLHMFQLLIYRPLLEKHNKEATACQELAPFYAVFIPVMGIMTLIILILEILEICTEGRRYFKDFINYLQWIYILFGGFTLIPVEMVHWRLVLNAQYQLSAIGILVIWGLLLLQSSKFKRLARYVDMLRQVLGSFCEFILAFSCLFIGFALCGLVLFSNFPAYESIPRALLKTLVVMSGEFNYEENFYRDIREVKVQGETGHLKNKHMLLYPVMSHFFLALFTIVCSLALMNLLIALAVKDVQVMLEKAEAKMLRRMINEIYHTEKVIHTISKVLPMQFRKRLQERISLNLPGNLSNIQTTLQIFPNRDAETKLDRPMRAALRAFVKKRELCHKSTQCS